MREVAARLDIAAHTLYRWVKTARPNKAEAQADELLASKRENLKLRAGLRRVQEERDILKKAAAFVAKEPE